MRDVMLIGLPATPIVVALVAAIGQALPMLPRRMYPLLAIALGVVWNLAVAAALDSPVVEAALGGVLIGLAASGLYSAAVKPVVQR